MVHLSVADRRGTDNHLVRTGFQKLRRARDRAHSAADAHMKAMALLGLAAQQTDRTTVAAAAHRGVEIDQVKLGITAEALEQAENVVHGEYAAAAADKLHRFAILKIDAGDNHGAMRTETPFFARNFFNRPMG